jgi:hypothetical protein
MPDIESLKVAAERVDAVVEQWFFETFHGSLIARSTEVWNLVHGAKDDLKRRFAALLAAAPDL